MQTIQNNALRIIFKKDRLFDIGRLHEIAGIESVKDRSIKLNKNKIYYKSHIKTKSFNKRAF